MRAIWSIESLRASLRVATLVVGVALGWSAADARAHALGLDGDFVQGGLVRGQVPPGSEVRLDGRRLRLADDGRFVFGFGRDDEGARLEVRFPDGWIERRTIAIERRDYLIQRIDGLPPRQVTPSEEDLARIRADARRIAAAKARDSAGRGFAQPAIWPAEGPVTGVYGSQRILNGEPRSPHRGVDVAGPTGTPVHAMADGIVSLAAPDLYFTGGTVMIDHGHGLHSIYAHLSEIVVEEGERIARGEALGAIGATGRVTGPHLHWGVYWFERAVDPAFLVGPPPGG